MADEPSPKPFFIRGAGFDNSGRRIWAANYALTTAHGIRPVKIILEVTDACEAAAEAVTAAAAAFIPSAWASITLTYRLHDDLTSSTPIFHTTAGPYGFAGPIYSS